MGIVTVVLQVALYLAATLLAGFELTLVDKGIQDWNAITAALKLEPYKRPFSSRVISPDDCHNRDKHHACHDHYKKDACLVVCPDKAASCACPAYFEPRNSSFDDVVSDTHTCWNLNTTCGDTQACASFASDLSTARTFSIDQLSVKNFQPVQFMAALRWVTVIDLFLAVATLLLSLVSARVCGKKKTKVARDLVPGSCVIGNWNLFTNMGVTNRHEDLFGRALFRQLPGPFWRPF
jgi:hypothetical protein